MEQTVTEAQRRAAQDELPWVVFRLQHIHYAVQSAHIQGIMVMPDTVTPLPDMQGYFMGIMPLREFVVPLLDLRRLFGMVSTQEEIREFQETIELRKEDHIQWARELRRCSESGEPFTLTTDPHQCAFGQWYDHYQADSLALAHQLKKIEDPHQLLHATAVKMEDPHLDEAGRQRLIEEAERLIPVIVSALDESSRLFASINRGMVIVLSRDDAQVGIVVDEVLSVEELEIVTDMKSSRQQAEYILQIAKSDKIAGEILTVDDSLLLATAQEVR